MSEGRRPASGWDSRREPRGLRWARRRGILAHRSGDGKAPIHRTPILIRVAVTFVVSRAAIRVVEKLSVKGGFYLFSIHCAVAGIAGLLYFSR